MADPQPGRGVQRRHRRDDRVHGDRASRVVVYIARTARKLYSLGWAVALGLLLGGAMGNLGDRIFRAPGLFRGYVVDWIGG